jgi:hypothetical protein
MWWLLLLLLQVLIVTADEELLKSLSEANRLLEQVRTRQQHCRHQQWLLWQLTACSSSMCCSVFDAFMCSCHELNAHYTCMCVNHYTCMQ